jgi:hypothetical protein
LQEFLKDTNIYTILSSIPHLGFQLLLFLIYPNEFTRNWINSPQTRSSPGEVVLWAVVLVSVLYGLYALAFKSSPFERFHNGSGADATAQTSSREQSNPRLLQITIVQKWFAPSEDGTMRESSREISINPLPGFEFPEAGRKGFHQPQLLVLKAGIATVYVGDVVPSFLASRWAQSILIGLYSLVTVICLHPPAAFLGAATPFAEALEFTIILYSFSFVFIATISLLVNVLLNKVFRVDVQRLNVRHSCLLRLVGDGFILGSLGRALFLAYQTLYALSFWQLGISLLGAFALSTIATPLVFVPLLLVLLKLKQLIEVFAGR